jgi:hypothetical protein
MAVAWVIAARHALVSPVRRRILLRWPALDRRLGPDDIRRTVQPIPIGGVGGELLL